MIWTIISAPLMLLAIAVAVLPVLVTSIRENRLLRAGADTLETAAVLVIDPQPAESEHQAA